MSTLPCPLGAKPNNVEKIKKTLNVEAESSNLPSLYELMTKAKLDFWENSSKDGNEKEWQTYIGKQSKKWLKSHYQSLCPLRSQELKSTKGRFPRKTRRKRRTLKRKA